MKLFLSPLLACAAAFAVGCGDSSTDVMANAGAGGEITGTGGGVADPGAGGTGAIDPSQPPPAEPTPDPNGGAMGTPDPVTVGGAAGAADMNTGGSDANGGAMAEGGAGGEDAAMAGANAGGAAGDGNAMGAHPDCPGCVSIFDGQTLDGWQSIGGEEWTVDDTGAIFSTGESAGALVTTTKYDRYRLIFSWQWLGSGHQANMLIWCRDVGARNCAGVQFQPPGRDVWDYGPANTSIKGRSDPPLMAVDVPMGDEGMCEMIVDSTAGTFKGACCNLEGAETCKTRQVVNLTYGSSLPAGELGFQAHNADHRIRWWNIVVEEDPVGDDFVTAE